MASAVAYNGGLGAGGNAPVWVREVKPSKAEKTFSICTSRRSDKFVIFSVYLQYFARASTD